MYELDMTPKGAFYRTWPRLAAQGSSGAVTALGLPWLSTEFICRSGESA
jgi:hypothetical protein